MNKKYVWIAVTALGIVGSVASILAYFSPGSLNQLTTGDKSPVISGRTVTVYYTENKSENDPLFRVAYYRMKGIAPDFLIKGMLSPDWEKLLGGPQEIVNNIVLKSAATVLQTFADEPFGDMLYSEDNSPISNSAYLDIGSYAKKISRAAPALNNKADLDEKWKTYLGGRHGYEITIPDIKALNIVLNTDHWPEDYKLYHAIGAEDADGNKITTPVIWRYLEKNDLDLYYKNIQAYHKVILRGANSDYVKYSIQSQKKGIEGLRYITKNGLPKGFILVEGSDAVHGGWRIHAILRDIELEVAVIENISNGALNIGSLTYKEVDANYLRTYTSGSTLLEDGITRTTSVYPAGKLLSREKIIIPTRIHFTYPDKIYKMDIGVIADPRYPSEYEKNGLISIKHPGNKEHLFFKSRSALKENSPPQLDRRFDYGPAWKLISIEINDKSYSIRPAEWNNFNLYLSNEKGSCPFVYTKEGNRAPWISEGHMLLGSISQSETRSEKMKLSHFSGEIQIRENEDEIAFIEDIFIEVIGKDQATEIFYPDRRFYQISNFDVVASGYPITYTFSDTRLRDTDTVFLHLRGYYKPFSQINLQKKVVESITLVTKP